MAVSVLATACGSDASVATIGGTEVERDELLAWLEARGQISAVGETTVDAAMTAEVLGELVSYESLLDLLAEHGTVADDEDLAAARDRLLAAGFDEHSPALARLTRWQAGLDAIDAGDPGVRAAYAAHADLYGHELCTSHILVSTVADAHGVLDLLATGSDFGELARQVSQDPGSGAQGGALGCVPLGAFVPTFERATLGALAAGEELLGPVPSQFGSHVIRIDEVRTVDPASFDDLGGRASMVLLGIASMTRDVSIDGRFGTWDPVVGRVSPPAAPAED